MSCNKCATTAENIAAEAGAPHVEATWSETRDQPQQCKECGGFLRRDGGCTRCEATEFSDNAKYLIENSSGDITTETEWEPSPDEPEATAIAIAAVRNGKTLTWQSEDGDNTVERELRYVPSLDKYGVESFYFEVQGNPHAGSFYEPPSYGELVQTDQEYNTYDTYEDAYAALQGKSTRRSSGPSRPGTDYFEANIDQVDPAWLKGFVESPGFSRQDGQKILTAIRQNAVDKLATRHYNAQSEIDQAVAAINANTMKHSAQVMVMATRISKLTGVDPKTARLAGLAAGYHDSNKDDTNFIYHHLDSARFAGRSLWDTGLAQAGGGNTMESAAEVADVRQAILTHMPFGRGSDPANFMNRALAAEAAGIVKVDGAAYKKQLRYLMNDALQQDAGAIQRVETWVDANASRYETKDSLAEAMRQEFAGRELSFPPPTSDVGRIVHNAAAGEHQAETIGGEDGRSLMESSHSAGTIIWAADGLTLSSAESLEKILNVHQRQWGRAGTEPIIVSASSLAGGAFGNAGTAVDAANSMTIPEVKESATQEIRLMRQFMAGWQRETLRQWESGPPPQPKDEVKQRMERPLFEALTAKEMLEFQPTLDEFSVRYKDFLRQNAHKRGALFRD